MNKKEGTLSCNPTPAGLNSCIPTLLHFLQYVGDVQIDSTFSNWCVQGHEWGLLGGSDSGGGDGGGVGELGSSKWGAAFSWNCK